jgi:uncharacterized membrane protein
MIALTIGLAVFVGISLGLLGGGGSILMVPLLAYGAGMEPKHAIAMSLLVVGVTSAVGAVTHARACRVQWRVAALFGVAAMTGAYVGGRLARFVPGRIIMIAFAVVMIAAAIAMLRGRKDSAGNDTRPAAAENCDGGHRGRHSERFGRCRGGLSSGSRACAAGGSAYAHRSGNLTGGDGDAVLCRTRRPLGHCAHRLATGRHGDGGRGRRRHRRRKALRTCRSERASKTLRLVCLTDGLADPHPGDQPRHRCDVDWRDPVRRRPVRGMSSNGSLPCAPTGQPPTGRGGRNVTVLDTPAGTIGLTIKQGDK